MPETVVGRDAHHDVPLSNIAITGFQQAQDYVAGQLFPSVPVPKQSDEYYIIDPDTWLRMGDSGDLRAPKTAPKNVEFKVSSDSYFAKNYARRTEIAKEDLANADIALALRTNGTKVVTEWLLRGQESRVAGLVTSISNVGSGVILAGGARWSDPTNSDPMSDINSAHEFIRSRTGLSANVMLMDAGTFRVVRNHPLVVDRFKYTAGGMISEAQLSTLFEVDKILIGKAVKNMANEGQAASMVNIWGNNVLLAVVRPGLSLQTVTFGLGFRWTPPGLPTAMQTVTYDHPDQGVKAEYVEVGYYQDEKIVARDLAYVIQSTI